MLTSLILNFLLFLPEFEVDSMFLSFIQKIHDLADGLMGFGDIKIV